MRNRTFFSTKCIIFFPLNIKFATGKKRRALTRAIELSILPKHYSQIYRVPFEGTEKNNIIYEPVENVTKNKDNLNAKRDTVNLNAILYAARQQLNIAEVFMEMLVLKLECEKIKLAHVLCEL